MTSALIKKEFQQHQVPFLLLTAISIFSFLVMMLGGAAEGNKLNTLALLAQFITFFSIPIAMIICRRLIIVEYEYRTHLFLEALPISRLHFFLTKYLLGLSLMLLIAGGITAACVCYNLLTSHIDGLFALILSLRAIMFLLVIYNFFFLMAYTGRYRLVIYILLLMSSYFISSQTNFEFNRTGPFALLNNTFAYERFNFPLQDLLISLAAALILAGLAFFLGLAREGSLATIFSKKMSHKEKVIMGIICCMVGFSMLTFQAKKKREPFDLLLSQQASGDGVTIKIAGDAENSLAHQELADFLHKELVLMRKYLAIDSVLPVFIIQNDSVPPMVYNRVPLQKTEGILLYVNINHPDFDPVDLESSVIISVLAEHTGYQTTRERNYWVLGGFAHYWSHRKPDYQKLVQMRAAYAMENQLTQKLVDRWYTLEKQIGITMLDAVGATGIMELHKNYPAEDVKKYLQIVLGTKHSRDVRSLFTSPRSDSRRVFKKVFKAHFGNFVSLWQDSLEDYKSLYRDQLSRIPRIDARLVTSRVSENSRSASLELEFKQTQPPAERMFYCFYSKLESIKNYTSTSEMKHFKNFPGKENTFELPEYYAPKDRIYYFVVIYSEKLRLYISSPIGIKEIEK